MSYEKQFSNMKTIVSNTRKNQIEEIAKSLGLPVSRLIAIAIEHEFEREKPFEYDMRLPKEEMIEMSYPDEGYRIIEYMKKFSGISQDLMVILRHDMGISDRATFLLALRDCIDKKFLVEYTPKYNAKSPFKPRLNAKFWRVPGTEKAAAKKIRKRASEYDRFKRLEKKYKGQ